MSDISAHGSAITASDLAAVKSRQRAAWASGDYTIIGTTLQIVGETLCEAVDLRSIDRVLDVAAGNGNATLAAARRFARVTSTDYVPDLLEHGRVRAEAENLDATFQVADAEALPFGSSTFDVVLSTFGVMFAPDQERAAAEMMRVCRTGGRIGLANWTPSGFIGRLFTVLGSYVPPPAGILSPARWGRREQLHELFPGVAVIEARRRTFNFRYRSADHWMQVFRTHYGPLRKAFAVLSPSRQLALEHDVRGLLAQSDWGNEAGLVIPSEYLEVVVRE